MIAVVQRVLRAEVRIAGRAPARIGPGLLILLGVARGDTATDAEWLAQKCSSLRIFNDDGHKMYLALEDVGGEVLVVSQFTLLGDCVKGRRPSWSHAADPGEAERLYEHFVAQLARGPHRVATGVFQAMMEVDSVNDGPVTLLIDTRDWKGRQGGAPEARGAERLLGLRQGPLHLASRSPRRARLLEMLGVRFDVQAPDEDGGAWRQGEDPGDYAMRQAEIKALSVARRVKGGIVLGADTVVCLDGEVLEKPAGPEQARAYLARLAGRRHEVYTGLCLARAGGETRIRGCERSRVGMSALDEGTIRDYVATGEPLDKAGAYGIQGVGGMLVESVDGCYFNVMGLPLARLRALLHEFERLGSGS
jgi:MAF protein/D-tyrosyl-tRNA(Tyr) deacylase